VFVDLEIIFNNTYGFLQFTYKVPKKYEKTIRVGDIVCVPFRNKIRNAVVVKTNSTVKLSQNIKTIDKRIGHINEKQQKYIKSLAISNNLNIGILLSQYIEKETLIKCETLNINKLTVNKNSSLSDNINNSFNIIFASSLSECKSVANLLVKAGKKVDFYQKTGGVNEFTTFWSNIRKFDNVVVLSVNFEKILVKETYSLHFFNSNNFSYNLPKLNNLNVIESSLLKHSLFGGQFHYYNEFPSLEYFTRLSNYFVEIPDVNINYIYGNNDSECLQIFDTLYHNHDLNIFTPIKDLKLISKNHRIIENNKTKNADVAILNNPTVSFNGILSSNRLVSFIKNITFFHKENIKIVIFTSKKIDIVKKLKSNQLNKWANKENIERSKYGPNRNIKVFKVISNEEVDFSGYENFVIGPRSEGDQLMYELKFKINKNINYNKVISLFNMLNKLSVERVKNL